VTAIKFCGLTRAEDAQAAVALGASYVGIIFAGGPRQLDARRAAEVLQGVPASVMRVGVVGAGDPRAQADLARTLGLGAIQMHADPSAGDVKALRAVWDGEIWAAFRVSDGEQTAGIADLYRVADAVVLDAKVSGALGGTGVALPWDMLARSLATARTGGARTVLAGGLRPENVAMAIAALRPEVVDVSSGVEVRAGIKDPARMRAFRDAVRSVESDS
jgi:phosphoribosylanthranilate isomerase